MLAIGFFIGVGTASLGWFVAFVLMRRAMNREMRDMAMRARRMEQDTHAFMELARRTMRQQTGIGGY